MSLISILKPLLDSYIPYVILFTRYKGSVPKFKLILKILGASFEIFLKAKIYS